MNYLIKPFSFVKNEDIKNAIARLVSCLEKYNYAVVSNGYAIRLFARSIPSFYKEKKIIFFTRKNNYGIIALNHAYKFAKENDKTFRITLKK